MNETITIQTTGAKRCVVAFRDHHHFPAWKVGKRTVVDLRMFGLDGKLGWCPEKLPSGLPETMLQCAATSNPRGFAMIVEDPK